MTHQPQEQIEDILTAIRKACPELMELGFGCEIRFTAKDSWHDPDSFGKVCEWSEVKGGLTGMKVWAGLNHYIDITKEQVTEIIGRPIHLEHLLRAMEEAATKVAEDGMTPETFALGAQMFHTLRDKYWTYIKDNYDLTLSLRQNLENTDLREFIHSLLKV